MDLSKATTDELIKELMMRHDEVDVIHVSKETKITIPASINLNVRLVAKQ